MCPLPKQVVIHRTKPATVQQKAIPLATTVENKGTSVVNVPSLRKKEAPKHVIAVASQDIFQESA